MSILNGKGLTSSYMKEGKGVDKNAPQKKGFFLFWDIVFRKIAEFIRMNLLYSLMSILWIAFLYIVAPVDSSMVEKLVGDAEGAAQMVQAMTFGLRAMFAMIVFDLWGNPLVAPSYAYVSRCFTLSKPVWVWSDGWDIFKENFKQSIVLFIVDAVVLILAINASYFYYAQYQSTGSYMWFFCCVAIGIAMFLYTIMHYYIYQIMTSFECTIMQLYKNAMLCALAHLPMAVIHTIISVGIIVLLSFAVYPGIVIVFNFAVGLCLTRFPMEFYAARVIKKVIKAKEKQESKNKARITYM